MTSDEHARRTSQWIATIVWLVVCAAVGGMYVSTMNVPETEKTILGPMVGAVIGLILFVVSVYLYRISEPKIRGLTHDD